MCCFLYWLLQVLGKGVNCLFFTSARTLMCVITMSQMEHLLRESCSMAYSAGDVSESH